jgi:hypothetical protein
MLNKDMDRLENMHRSDSDMGPDRDRQMGVGSDREDREIGGERHDTDPDRDTDLQREGNLGNERNRNQPDSERGSGRRRDKLNR